MQILRRLADPALKRLYKFILKKSIGQYLLEELDLDQLDFRLRKGRIQLQDLKLNVPLLNDQLLQFGLPFRLREGVIGCVKVSVSYKKLLSESCVIELSGIVVTLEPFSHAEEATSPNPTSSPEPHDAGKMEEDTATDFYNTESLDIIASWIDQVVSRIKVQVSNVTFRLLDPESGNFIVVNLPDITYSDETPHQETDTDTFADLNYVQQCKRIDVKGIRVALSIQGDGTERRQHTILDSVGDSLSSILIKIGQPVGRPLDVPKLDVSVELNSLTFRLDVQSVASVSALLEAYSRQNATVPSQKVPFQPSWAEQDADADDMEEEKGMNSTLSSRDLVLLDRLLSQRERERRELAKKSADSWAAQSRIASQSSILGTSMMGGASMEESVIFFDCDGAGESLYLPDKMESTGLNLRLACQMAEVRVQFLSQTDSAGAAVVATAWPSPGSSPTSTSGGSATELSMDDIGTPAVHAPATARELFPLASLDGHHHLELMIRGCAMRLRVPTDDSLELHLSLSHLELAEYLPWKALGGGSGIAISDPSCYTALLQHPILSLRSIKTADLLSESLLRAVDAAESVYIPPDDDMLMAENASASFLFSDDADSKLTDPVLRVDVSFPPSDGAPGEEWSVHLHLSPLDVLLDVGFFERWAELLQSPPPEAQPPPPLEEETAVSVGSLLVESELVTIRLLIPGGTDLANATPSIVEEDEFEDALSSELFDVEPGATVDGDSGDDSDDALMAGATQKMGVDAGLASVFEKWDAEGGEETEKPMPELKTKPSVLQLLHLSDESFRVDVRRAKIGMALAGQAHTVVVGELETLSVFVVPGAKPKPKTEFLRAPDCHRDPMEEHDQLLKGEKRAILISSYSVFADGTTLLPRVIICPNWPPGREPLNRMVAQWEWASNTKDLRGFLKDLSELMGNNVASCTVGGAPQTAALPLHGGKNYMQAWEWTATGEFGQLSDILEEQVETPTAEAEETDSGPTHRWPSMEPAQSEELDAAASASMAVFLRLPVTAIELSGPQLGAVAEMSANLADPPVPTYLYSLIGDRTLPPDAVGLSMLLMVDIPLGNLSLLEHEPGTVRDIQARTRVLPSSNPLPPPGNHKFLLELKEFQLETVARAHMEMVTLLDFCAAEVSFSHTVFVGESGATSRGLVGPVPFHSSSRPGGKRPSFFSRRTAEEPVAPEDWRDEGRMSRAIERLQQSERGRGRRVPPASASRFGKVESRRKEQDRDFSQREDVHSAEGHALSFCIKIRDASESVREIECIGEIRSVLAHIDGDLLWVDALNRALVAVTEDIAPPATPPIRIITNVFLSAFGCCVELCPCQSVLKEFDSFPILICALGALRFSASVVSASPVQSYRLEIRDVSAYLHCSDPFERTGNELEWPTRPGSRQTAVFADFVDAYGFVRLLSLDNLGMTIVARLPELPGTPSKSSVSKSSSLQDSSEPLLPLPLTELTLKFGTLQGFSCADSTKTLTELIQQFSQVLEAYTSVAAVYAFVWYAMQPDDSVDESDFVLGGRPGVLGEMGTAMDTGAFDALEGLGAMAVKLEEQQEKDAEDAEDDKLLSAVLIDEYFPAKKSPKSSPPKPLSPQLEQLLNDTESEEEGGYDEEKAELSAKWLPWGSANLPTEFLLETLNPSVEESGRSAGPSPSMESSFVADVDSKSHVAPRKDVVVSSLARSVLTRTSSSGRPVTDEQQVEVRLDSSLMMRQKLQKIVLGKKEKTVNVAALVGENESLTSPVTGTHVHPQHLNVSDQAAQWFPSVKQLKISPNYVPVPSSSSTKGRVGTGELNPDPLRPGSDDALGTLETLLIPEQTVLFRLRLEEGNVCWRLFAGNDWRHESPSLPLPKVEEEDGPGRRKHDLLAALVSDYVPADGVDAEDSRKLSTAPGRRADELIEVRLKGVVVRVDTFLAAFPEEGEEEGRGPRLVGRVVAALRDFEVIDRISSSVVKVMLGLAERDSVLRENGTAMFRLWLDTLAVYEGPKTAHRMEYRMKIETMPLRLHLAQPSIGFLQDFALSAGDVPANAQRDPETPDFFFQFVEIKPVLLLLDVVPHSLDFGALRSGDLTQLLNMLTVEGLELRLRPLRMENVPNWEALLSALGETWSKQITRGHLHRCIASINTPLLPLRSLANIGQGAADLVLMPVSQFRSDGRFVHGVRRGVSSFFRVLTLELLSAGSNLAGGAQHMLEGITQIGSGAPPSIDGFPSSQPALRADDVPRGAGDGLRLAAAQLGRNMRSALHTVIAVPIETFHRDGATGAVRAVVRAVPVALLKPMIGTVGAVSTALKGLRNAMDPSQGRDQRRKFKS